MPKWITPQLRYRQAAVATAARGTAEAASRSRVAAQGLVEYGILIAVVAIAALAAIQTFGGEIAAFFNRLLTHFAGLG